MNSKKGNNITGQQNDSDISWGIYDCRESQNSMQNELECKLEEVLV